MTLAREALQQAIPHTLNGIDMPSLGTKYAGKVRDSYALKDKTRLIITTDRVSAFDRILGQIPYKGQVLNQLSAWWFEQLNHIIPNHMISTPDPNVMHVYQATPLPVEVVVRGYITGVTSTSLWTLYEQGNRAPYGVSLPEGLKKNDPLPRPIITPTTKAQDGAHDEIITRDEIIARGLIEPELWEQIEDVAIELFLHGQSLAQTVGMLLVDTKYEFGLYQGKLMLIDEVHTPDSSRFWARKAYQEGNPQSLSKEFLREWFVAQGYRGEGTPPKMPDAFIVEVAERYITLYERMTAKTFEAGELPVQSRILNALTPFTLDL